MNPTPPRLLLVEDDPVSASFLATAAAALPARVDVAGSVAEAMAQSASGSHDLLLVDANLPDGRGETLLQRLRERGVDTPALAHTAARGAAMRERLLEAGFADVFCKPLGMEELHDVLRRQLGLPPPGGGQRPDWDDEVALAALGGQRAHVDAMRKLFLQELPSQRLRIAAAFAAGDATAIRAELHRLAASCGFVGAPRLAQAVRAMQDVPLDAQRLQGLGSAIDDLQQGPA